MKICLCCKQCEIKPTFSFYCRWCYNYLQQKYNIDITILGEKDKEKKKRLCKLDCIQYCNQYATITGFFLQQRLNVNLI